MKDCVRVEHLWLDDSPAARRRRERPFTSRVQVQVNGLRVQRRVHGSRTDVESVRALLREQLRQAAPQDRDATQWSLDDLSCHYLEYAEDQGKELRTRMRYASVAKNWITPVIGTRPARRVTPTDIDRCFVRMRKAGQSAASMNYAKALLSGAFKWARRTGKIFGDPMSGFQMPKSTYVPREKLPPEIDDVLLILTAALEHSPDIAPILALATTTGARLGELIASRRSDISWDRRTIRMIAAADIDGTLKDTKRSQHHREVPLDAGTLSIPVGRRRNVL